MGGALEKVVSTLHVGSEAVMQAMAELPGTKHDIDGPLDQFCVDAFPVPQGEVMNLLVTMHGRFAEGECGRSLCDALNGRSMVYDRAVWRFSIV
jgi:hypothetical protein